MKPYNEIKRSFGRRLSTLVGFAAIMAVAPNAFALQMRVCGRWRAQYTDSGLGEDVYTTSVNYVGAAYARYRVRRASDWQVINQGVLNTSGCSSYFTVTSGTEYLVEQATKLERSTGRIVYVQGIQASTPANYYNTYRWAIMSFTPNGTGYVTYSPIVNMPFHSNIMPVAERMIRYANTLDIPSNSTFRIVGLPSGSAYDGNGNIRIFYSAGGTDHSEEKFRVAHELGHAVGDVASNHLTPGGQCSLTHASNYCNCTGITGSSHCLQSWERIQCAQGEGFGHFAAAVMMNYRNDGDGVFGSYRSTRFPNPPNPDVWELAPWGVDLTDSVTWMEDNCSASMNDRGVEWDWATFFWQVWAIGSYRIDVSDIQDIWPDDGDSSSDYHWNDPYPDVTDIAGFADTELENTYEYNYFMNVADENGVDH